MFLSDEGLVKLSDYGLVKLSDYGLGEYLHYLLSEKSVHWYMAPEAFEGKREQKSDVWSLGISLMELAEGRNPFKGCSHGDAWDRVCEHSPPYLGSEEWPPAFVNFVSKCLVKDVEERWSVEQLMEVSCLSEE